MRHSYWQPFFLLLACGLVFAAYLPGISGDFIFDDHHSVVLNEALRINELSFDSLIQLLKAGDPGVLGRPVSMLAFGLNYYWAGDVDALSFKLANIGFHVFAFIGVYGFTHSVLSVYIKRGVILPEHTVGLAFIISLVWALSPLQVSSVLYVVQRMTMLSAAFSCYALWVYMLWRQGKWVGAPAIFTFLTLSVLAFLSKENAILIAGFVLLLEMFVLDVEGDGCSKSNGWAIYRKWFFIAAVISFIAVVIYLHVFKGWYSSGYLTRDFSQYERILTQFRMLVTYLQWIVIPDIGQYAFFHDDIEVSTSWLEPVSTLVCALMIGISVIGALLLRKKYIWYVFGLGWFLVGHLLESTFIPLEIVFEHRNYLPSFGIIFLLVITIYRCFLRFNVRSLLLLLSLIWLLFLTLATVLRSSEWGDYHTQFLSATERHPASARSHWALASWYMLEYEKGLALNVDDPFFYDQALVYAGRSSEADARSSLALLGLLGFHCEIEKSIKPEWIGALKVRLDFPYRAENHAMFKQLVDCAIDYNGAEQIRSVVENILLIAINNREISDGWKADLQYLYAMYLYAGNKVDQAFSYFEQSLSLFEHENTYARLILHSLELKNKENAVHYLAKYKAMLGASYKDSEQYRYLSSHVDGCCEGNVEFKFDRKDE